MVRVLIIEDDPDQIAIYKDQFEILGFEVEVASTPEEGANKARSASPDAILLDIRLQSKNTGLEVLRKLKQDEVTRGIPVIVFTNFSKKTFEKEALAAGAVKYIVKTDVVPRVVVGEIRDVIGEKEEAPVSRPEKILLIEDNEMHRDMYKLQFSKSGFTLLVAVNGEDGLEIVKNEHPALVLLDLALPSMSGVDVLKRLKEEAGTKDIPVIAFTVTPRDLLPDETRAFVEENTSAYFEKATHLPKDAVTLVEKVLQSISTRN